MLKLRISEKYLKEFEKWNDPENMGYGEISYLDSDLEIDIITNRICNTSCFRKILHKIIELCFENDMNIQKEISEKNYTNLILIGVLHVIDI